jgi:hypothetical protein
MTDFDWDKPQETNIPDWDKQGPGKSIAKRPGDPTFPQQMGGFAVGAGTEILGFPGDIQKTARDIKHWASKKTGIPESPITFPTLPTSSELRQDIKGTPLEPDPRTKFMQKTGEVTADVLMAAPSSYRGLGKMAGETTAETERIASIAEKLGFKLSPSQLRAESPIAEKGALFASKENQLLANRLVSRGTGKIVDEVTESFLRERIKTLGKEFDDIYKGKVFNIDSGIKPTLENLIEQEKQLGFGGITDVKTASDSILKNIDQGKILGDDLQRLRNALTQAARTTDNRGKAHEIYNLVDTLDAAVETRNPGLKATLDVLRPKYRNTVILEDLMGTQGIKGGNVSLERLGNQLADSSMMRRNPQDIDTYGALGRELGIRARWETAGEEAPGVVKEVVKTHGALPTVIKRALGSPLRSTTARKAQKYAQREAPATQKVLEALGATAPIEHIVRPADKR